MSRFAVSATRRAPLRVPPAGLYVGTIARLVELEADPGYYDVAWRFRVAAQNGRQYTLPQTVDQAGLSDILHDLGMAGQEVELTELVGSRAQIKVTTFGGKKSARVTDVSPIVD